MTTYNFPPTSRYYGIDVVTLALTDGRSVSHLRRRFVPPAERFALLHEHAVNEGDRLDLITARYLDDPEAFWRIADANSAMRPQDLVRVGRRLRITLPEGIPGTPNA